MDREHWLRLLLGAGVSLVVAIVSAVIRLVISRRVRPPGTRPTSKTTDTLTFRIERHREVRPGPEDRSGDSAPDERPGAEGPSDRDEGDEVA